MQIIKYSDFMEIPDIAAFCQSHEVIFDFKLFDIPNTMHRNVKTAAEIGAAAITVADHPYNQAGIAAARAAGDRYGIQIVVGDLAEV